MSCKLPEPDRVLHLSFEADDAFLAEVKVLHAEAEDFKCQIEEFNQRQHEEYAAALERFRERVLGKPEAIN